MLIIVVDFTTFPSAVIDASTKAPLTDARAGWPVSLIVAGMMFLSGQIYLDWAIHLDVKAGHGWESRAGEAVFNPTASPGQRVEPTGPHVLQSFVPLVVTVVALNLLPLCCRVMAQALSPLLAESGTTGERLLHAMAHIPEDPTLSIFLGSVAALALLGSRVNDLWKSVGEGFTNGFIAIGSTAAIVGFGSAVKDLPAFQRVVFWVTHLPGDPLLGAALAVAVIAAIAGSASGGQGIALPILKPIYVDELGVAPRALHRVVAIASGSLDTLPANGFVVMLIRVVCGETHARAYGPIFVTTVLIPFAGTLLAILFFKLQPSWAQM